jgi:hypothetical protein
MSGEPGLKLAAANLFLEGVVKPVAGVVGERSRFGIAKNVDGLSRRVYYYPAITALHQMLLDFGSKRGVNTLIEIIGKLAQNLGALRFCNVHDASPCRK